MKRYAKMALRLSLELLAIYAAMVIALSVCGAL